MVSPGPDMTAADWIEHFPPLAALGQEHRDAVLASAHPVRLPAEMRVFDPGSPCSQFLLVVDGCVRVQMIADTGRELVLYRVRRGETCVLTTSCLFGGEVYPAEGIVETETHAVAIPLARFLALIAASEGFRRFVFAGFGQRLAALLATVQDTVFHNLDGRLARALIARAGGGPVALTHQALAAEIGTAREVVSRHLKQFEKAGLVRLARGRIEIADPHRLALRAARTE